MPVAQSDWRVNPERVEDIAISCETIASRVRFLRRHIDYVNEKVTITRWLLQRLRGLPECVEEVYQSASHAYPAKSNFHSGLLKQQ